MNKIDVKEIWEMVKANKNKINSCILPHEFEEDKNEGITSIYRWVCRKCKGATSSTNLFWYLKGLEDGNNDKNDTYNKFYKETYEKGK